MSVVALLLTIAALVLSVPHWTRGLMFSGWRVGATVCIGLALGYLAMSDNFHSRELPASEQIPVIILMGTSCILSTTGIARSWIKYRDPKSPARRAA